MRLTYTLCCSAVVWALGLAAATPARTLTTGKPSFTYNATHFLLNGEPHQIIGGQMDPQRIPPAYWRDRLQKARAMGLNTIFTYTFWNLLEPVQGNWDNEESKGIATFFEIAQEEGLYVVLRPGPYVCGEREWGGFPAWLSTVPGLVVRANNQPFLEASESYLSNLASGLRGLYIHEGGPILMVQVENEYGSYAADHDYTAAIKDILQRTFGDVVLYTNDGTEQWTLEGGSVPGVLAEVDGDPRAGFAALRKYITDPSRKGPLLDGEYYTWTFDSWGYPRSTPNTQGFVDDLEYVLGNESASISLYMVHGGTNFGFGNGALWQNKTRAFTSSYDYGAPIDEAGRTTDLFWKLRETIAKYVPEGSIPDVREDVPLKEIPAFDLTPAIPLFSALGVPTYSKTPLTMEQLNQSYGFVLYEHIATSSASGLLSPGDRPRDRVIVYINDTFHGVIDSTYTYHQNISLNLVPGTKLQLLVENLGRVDYYSRGTDFENMILDPYKGILGDISVGTTTLEQWAIYTVPLDSLPDFEPKGGNVTALNGTQPVFYTGSFTVDGEAEDSLALDTYLEIEGGVKGNVWVNGFHLGRYWRVGPQTSLYLSGTVLRQGENQVVVLELEPGHVQGGLKGVGLSERFWAVAEDVDCLGCM
ncbi:family 35 glycoside hydrolase [Bimuria novae-zelandiae CBS 107.79]|uniref:Beta-galactosidase n=1 Tax=Bimuria novae-zelandiae CBS 107.79 TaxID=1447943 RepID=A0A6A5VAW5_9PLEO|nr:family 35 glycoside hydrolase [Bimuria novae-zelandiae CBS 107.79]